ncbi:Hypothetical protein NTJ_15442 [Nesidiocoris tenuis]|uniref:Uncharacterized protein n=1 Tax=Nesidiocoris tenuis TaxID=355587 RepID=A0ABN7BEB6_9HEMI|nr:Hypothetical protein NTJ_15442 [Nesidiocoris tenuis]
MEKGSEPERDRREKVLPSVTPEKGIVLPFASRFPLSLSHAVAAIFPHISNSQSVRTNFRCKQIRPDIRNISVSQGCG